MTLAYEVHIEQSAERDLKKLPKEMFQRITARIRALAQNPRPRGSVKLKGSKNGWRIRIGGYRVLYEINDKKHRILVMAVKPRSIAYRAVLSCSGTDSHI